MLGMMTLMPSFCLEASAESYLLTSNRQADSLVITRMWNYAATYCTNPHNVEKNIYMNYTFGLKRRNFLLLLVPSMYDIARGKREYNGESYGKLKFQNNNNFKVQRQVVCGTIPHNSEAMPMLFELMTPNIYGRQLYYERLLSPFHRSNRFYYKYRVSYMNPTQVWVNFRPRSGNTQLVKGYAVVDVNTGYINSLMFQGEFDMVRFKVSAQMASQESHSTLPERCRTEASFGFLGNKVESQCESYNNCPTTLPDSIVERDDPVLMSHLRPKPLTVAEDSVYRQYERQIAQERSDSTHYENNKFKKVAWEVIGDNMINSIRAGKGPFTFRTSPLLNPLYMGYSQSKGISYKLKLNATYNFDTNHYLTFYPQFGYSFKRKQFYYTLPLRMTYNPGRNAYVEVKYGNGERISNDILAETYNAKKEPNAPSMPEFKDRFIEIGHNIKVFKWLDIMTGIIYHARQSANPSLMEKVNLPYEYCSFAPTLTFKLTPWERGPVLTANYEHSFKNVMKSDFEYDRWEFDASYLHNIHSVKFINMRVGTGFYTRRNSAFFVDYTNFRNNTLPTAWEDDWSGQFQLLPVGWYNKSRYYIRGNISYDSPLLALSWIPWVGQFIENERIYVSALSIQNTKPYMEIGYGLKNRLFSTAVFASFLSRRIQRVGFKFTIEIFSRW